MPPKPAKPAPFRFEFQAQFRRNGFGWKSRPAIERVKQAVAEIRRVARREPELAAEGAVRFLERVSPALTHVDSSSGAIGTAVNRAIAQLAEIIGAAPADTATRVAWLDRLWAALAEDRIPCLEALADHWATLCGTKEAAAAWLDRLNSDDGPAGCPSGHCNNAAQLGALARAGRLEELLQWPVSHHPRDWQFQRHVVRALLDAGQKDRALALAERCSEAGYQEAGFVAEELLLGMGRSDEAYARHALAASQRPTFVATFRELRRKYPKVPPERILADAVRSTPGAGGKWFAAAKDAGLFREAIELARRSKCDPATLARAARDHCADQPEFAAEAGFQALRWMAEGEAAEVDARDLHLAYDSALSAAAVAGGERRIQERVRKLLSGPSPAASWMRSMLPREAHE